MLHKSKTYAVITGASSGLGYEFAVRLAKHGYKCILTARREDRLKDICKKISEDPGVDNDISYIVADLSKTEDCEKICRELEGKRLGVFINNAGFGDCGDFLDCSLEKEMSMIDVNIRALHYLTKKILSIFDRQGYGYLLNVSSSAGLIPAGPHMATYYATKSYVTSLSLAIARELKEQSSSVYVGILCPGPVDTEFNSVANVSFSLPGISARMCVDEAIKGMYKRKTVIIPSLKMKLAIKASRLIPSDILIGITSKQQQKKL